MAHPGTIETDFSTRRIIALVWTGAFLTSLTLFLQIPHPDLVVIAATLAIGTVLLLIAIHDERTFLIPDRLVLALCVIAAGFHVLREPDRLPSLTVAGAVGFGFLWAVRCVHQALRGQPGLGLGDAKLLGAAGLLVGAEGLIGVLLWAVLTALLFCAALALAGKLRVERGARIRLRLAPRLWGLAHLALGTTPSTANLRPPRNEWRPAMSSPALTKDSPAPGTPDFTPANSSAGYTLVEVLVVLGIIAMLTAVVGPRLLTYFGEAKVDTARLQINQLSSAVELYYLDTGNYPPAEAGLSALVTKPAGTTRWNGPYLKKVDGLTDPWGKPYIYRSPGEHAAFDILSLGRDNAKGGDGEDVDIGSW